MKLLYRSTAAVLSVLVVGFALLQPRISLAQDAGSALRFDGVDDFVELGDILNDVDIPFTISTWMRIEQQGFNFPIRIEDDVEDIGQYYGFWLFINELNEICVHFGDGTGDGASNRRALRTPSIDLVGTWAHITAVVEGPSNMAIYVNGEQVEGQYEGDAQVMLRSSMPGRLGRSSPRGTFSFNGQLDEFRIYNRALEEEEIGNDMHRTIDADTEGLAAYWSFDEGEGQHVANTIPTLPDGILGFDETTETVDPQWTASFAPISTRGCITTAAFTSGIFENRRFASLRGMTLSDQSLLDSPQHNIVFSEDNLTNTDYIIDDLPEGIEGRWNRTWCLDFSDAIFDQTGSILVSFTPGEADFAGMPVSSDSYRLIQRRGRTGTLQVVTDSLGEPVLANVLEDSTVQFSLSPGSALVNGNPLESGDFTIGVLENPLPVELTTFSVYADGRVAHLNWTTASESNNAGFTIERSMNSEPFQSIAFVPGAGTTSEQTHYQYTDDLAQFGEHQWNYRLKQIDFDGTITYSRTIDIQTTPSTAVKLHPAYPNPFNAQVIFQYELPRSMHIRLALYDLNGREIAVLQEGVNTAGRHHVQFDAYHLPSGTYSLQLQAEHQSYTELIFLTK